MLLQFSFFGRNEKYNYDPFGGLYIIDPVTGALRQQSVIGNRYMFTGREWEPESGLYYYRARWYDPGVGRFLGVDPIRFSGGVNFYSYVESNPVNFTDPYGLWRWWGNWGGPDWTGGQIRPYEDLTEKERRNLKEPIDSLDKCFQQHDIDYSRCRVAKRINECSKGKIYATKEYKKCIKEADKRLYRCLKNLPKNPRRWDNPPQDPFKANRARRWAQWYFYWF